MVYSENEIITVRDLICPAFESSADDEETVVKLLSDVDDSFGGFVTC